MYTNKIIHKLRDIRHQQGWSKVVRAVTSSYILMKIIKGERWSLREVLIVLYLVLDLIVKVFAGDLNSRANGAI